MSTSFPGAVDSYTTHSTGDIIQASYDDNLQDAVVAIENLLVGPVFVSGALTVAAINAAIVAANTAGGGVVLIPPGTVTVTAASGSIILMSNVHVWGAGPNATIITLGTAANIDAVTTY